MHAHLVFFIDVYIEYDLISARLLVLYNVDNSILIALVIKILFSQDFSTVDDVTSKTHTLYHTQLSFHILALGFLDTVIINGGDTWTHTQMDTKIELITYNRVGSDANFREQTITPVAFYCFCNLGTWNFNLLADS